MTNNTTPSYQEMINAIYEKIARKDLSLGCKVIIQYMNSDPEEEVIVVDYIENSDYIRTTFYGIVLLNYIKKIIGHPVMIGDVMDWIEKNIKVPIQTETILETLPDGTEIPVTTAKVVSFNKTTEGAQMSTVIFAYKLWKEKRKPIEEQSKECIEFIYNLIP